jgi:hypothetical protein
VAKRPLKGDNFSGILTATLCPVGSIPNASEGPRLSKRLIVVGQSDNASIIFPDLLGLTPFAPGGKSDSGGHLAQYFPKTIGGSSLALANRTGKSVPPMQEIFGTLGLDPMTG